MSYKIIQETKFHTKPQKGIVVDCGCKGNPGKAEYKGINIESNEILFHYEIPGISTNNIAEWLACVHGLRIAKKLNLPVYSDSLIAIKWCRMKKCLTNFNVTDKQQLFVIELANQFLRTNNQKVMFWQNKLWGENPADLSGLKGIKKTTYKEFKENIKSIQK